MDADARYQAAYGNVMGQVVAEYDALQAGTGNADENGGVRTWHLRRLLLVQA